MIKYRPYIAISYEINKIKIAIFENINFIFKVFGSFAGLFAGYDEKIKISGPSV